MIKLTKKANVFVYTLILINLALIIAYVVYNNSYIISNNLTISENSTLLTESLKDKGNIALNSVKQYNSNGGGFVDNISCPETITVSELNSSGALVVAGVVSPILYNDYGDIYCRLEYGNDIGKLVFDNSGFKEVYLNNEKRSLTNTGGILMNEEAFSGNGFYIGFFPPTIGDCVDDNMNNDDYKGTFFDSCISNLTKEYIENYIDDDVVPRLTFFNEIAPESKYFNVFWNNTRTLSAINDNQYNNELQNLTLKIGDTQAGNLYFDLSSSSELDYNIRLIKFDRNVYNNENTLIPIESYEGKNIKLNGGYLYLDSNNKLSLNKIKTGEEFSFDFKNSDYAIFIQNNTNDSISLKITGEEKISDINQTGRKIYINPINDSKNNTIEVLVNHIIINENNFIHSHLLMSTDK